MVTAVDPAVNPTSPAAGNARYQDYVIKDGAFVGRFEEMYRDCENPWNQRDGHYNELSYSRVATILNVRRFGIRSLVEVGCGLGYYTQMLRHQTGARVLGIDVSPTAIAEARKRLPDVDFEVGRATDLARYAKNHDAVLFAEVTWYILPELRRVFDTLLENMRGKYLLHNLVFYKGQQKYGREYFASPDEFIDFVPFRLVARAEGTTVGDDTIETSMAFIIEPKEEHEA